MNISVGSTPRQRNSFVLSETSEEEERTRRRRRTNKEEEEAAAAAADKMEKGEGKSINFLSSKLCSKEFKNKVSNWILKTIF